MAKKLAPTTSQTEVVIQKTEETVVVSRKKTETQLLFGKQNYRFMLIGIALVVFGFILMIGGSMPDENTWDESLIYSFTRITLSPIVILIGLGIEVYAIFFEENKTVATPEIAEMTAE